MTYKEDGLRPRSALNSAGLLLTPPLQRTNSMPTGQCWPRGHRVGPGAGGRQARIGAVQPNTIEGVWSLIKRGMVGTFHKVSKRHPPLYVAEVQFRYNNRLNADIFGAAIKEC